MPDSPKFLKRLVYDAGMNKLALATLTVAAILTPGLTQAQSVPPQIRQTHEKMMQLDQQARSAALVALTPAHRELLGQVVGRLATDNNADVPGAARTLDRTLTPAESQAVLRISNNLRTQARQLMEAAFAQMPNGPGVVNVRVTDVRQNFKFDDNASRQTDAGYVLLQITMPHPETFGMWVIRKKPN